MKFFTRELYKAMQAEPETPEAALFDAQGKANCDAYRKHLESIRHSLPKSMREFCETTLHDGIIKSARQPTNDSLIFEIDGNGCCWGPIGQFELQFDGVEGVEGMAGCIGDWWLYEEVHWYLPESFDYRVLLSQSELRIVAKIVTFTVIVEGKRPIVRRVKGNA